jgi:hypothetical protein
VKESTGSYKYKYVKKFKGVQVHAGRLAADRFMQWRWSAACRSKKCITNGYLKKGKY